MIKTQALCKTFLTGFRRRKIHALQGLDLEIEKGEIFGFLGPNGAGKTTTIKILAGLIKPSSGKAFVLGKPAGEVESRARIGFLPEQPYFYDYLTGREFLNFCAKFFPMTEQERKQRINSLLSLVGLDSARDLALRKYSKGMLQRIGLAQALVNDPELVILDEPMSGLDPLGRKEIRDLISGLKEKGKTVFFNTHIISDVEIICDRVGIIDKGRLLKVGVVEEIASASIRRWELQAEVRDAELRRELEARAGAGQCSLSWQKELVLVQTSDEAEAAALARLLLEKKARLLDYSARRQSLEEFFVKMVGEQNPR
jgi:ABC-2 type transport system ATP-binding protein